MNRLGLNWAVVMTLGMLLVMAGAAETTGAKICPPVFDLDDYNYIVGDNEEFSTPYNLNMFVSQDAIRLTTTAFDAHTSAGAIRWSYSSPDKKIVLNGARPVDPELDNLVSPKADQRIDLNADPIDPTDPGLTPMVWIRHNLWSPIDVKGGLGPYPEPGSSDSAKVTTDTGTVILYASNGTTVSASRPITITAWNTHQSAVVGHDYLMTKFDFRQRITDNWAFKKTGGNATKQPNNGMSITGRRVSNDDASWACRYPAHSMRLAKNNVIEVRANVTTTNMNPFATPTWMMVYKNLATDGSHGHNEYGGEVVFVDNEWGSNSPIPGTGRHEFRMYIMPTQMQAPQFASSTTGFFGAPDPYENEMSVSFRLMGMPGTPYSPNYSAISVHNMRIWNHDIRDMKMDESVYSVNQFVDAKITPTSPNAWGTDVIGQAATSKFNSDGSVTISPVTDWTNGTVIMFRPGDSKIHLTQTPPDYLDDYPIKWVANQLYYVEFTLSAPSVWAEVNSPDMIRVGADTLTSELVCDSFAVPNTPDLSGGVRPKMVRGLSMPRYATPQKYGCFFYTHSISKTNIPDGARWRPRFEILTSKALQPMGRATNLAGVTVHSVTVKRVHFDQ